jgi:hypothetical protein
MIERIDIIVEDVTTECDHAFKAKVISAMEDKRLELKVVMLMPMNQNKR